MPLESLSPSRKSLHWISIVYAELKDVSVFHSYFMSKIIEWNWQFKIAFSTCQNDFYIRHLQSFSLSKFAIASLKYLCKIFM